jgi:hypothetical protein
MQYVFTTANKAEWAAKIDEFERALTAVKIPSDFNPGMGKLIMSQLNDIYDNTRRIFTKAQQQLKAIEVIIDSEEKRNRTGNNEDARRKNAIDTLHNFTVREGLVVDLYDVLIESSNQYLDIKSIMDAIQVKISALITISGYLKVEANLTPGADY